MKNVLSYSRISSDDQSQHSIAFQEETIQRYCERKGYNIIATYKEDCSAKDFDRPEWKRILSFIKSSQKTSIAVDAIVILRPDRYSRNLILSFTEIAKLLGFGCEVEFVEGQVDNSSPDALLLQAIGYALPQIENAKISRRSCEGSHKARTLGCFTGIAPKGYKNFRLDTKSTLEFNSDAPLIKEAFEKMASGIYSADEIRRWLNSKGMSISKNTFLGIIRNVTYTGKIRVKEFRGEPEQIVQGLHPALVTDELFTAAIDVLNGRKRKMKFKDDKADLYPLKGHLVCPIHGRSLSAYGSRSRNGQIYHYYVCTKNLCPRYPIDHAHSEIERLLGVVQFSARVIKSYRSILERIFQSEDSNRSQLIQNTKDEIQRLKQRKTHIQDEYMDGKISSLDYNELKMGLDTKVFEKERTLKDLNEEYSPYKEYLNRHVPALEDLTSLYNKVDGRTKKQILSCIFSEKVHFENGKAATPKFTTPIEILINASKVLEKNKKGKEVISDLLFTLAPSLGLEPRTL
ncbi:recombinase family protein [Flavobacterium sp. W22_SRS_FP1]|uniref:recombinase family protein n=1 Tax=Flavobacterium sp. W22_SRS_FP1 TaxID=3240276 RepID=UPI003F91113E